VMITHDPEDLVWFGERAFYLRDGAIAEQPVAQPAKTWPLTTSP